MKKVILIVFVSVLVHLNYSYAQTIKFDDMEFEIVNVKASTTSLNGEKVIKIERDLEKLPFDVKRMGSTVDEPTFIKVKNADLADGVIEVKMLSRIQSPSPFEAARGFIGVAYRINKDNSAFDAIYLRPSNGRADDQFRRNHTVQYYAYPDYKFDRLRKEANGEYETYADIGLNEWISIRIEIKDKKAVLYVNDQKSPAFIVNEMKGNTKSGGIGLWVDIGTEGYFKDFKFTKTPQKN